jgi:hypothetical protein
MVTTIIEEGIYDVDTKESIKKAIFTFDGERLTRQLIYPDAHNVYRNQDDIIDIIDGTTMKIKLSLNDMLNSKIDYETIIESIKEKVKDFDVKNVVQRNIDAELPAFKNPIITIK